MNNEQVFQVGDNIDLLKLDGTLPLTILVGKEEHNIVSLKREGREFLLESHNALFKFTRNGASANEPQSSLTWARGYPRHRFAVLEDEYSMVSEDRREALAKYKEISAVKNRAFEKMVDCAIREIAPNRRFGGVRIVAVCGICVWVKSCLHAPTPFDSQTMTDRDFAIKYIIGKDK